MEKLKFNLIAIFTCFVMAISMLAGCTKNEEEVTTESNQVAVLESYTKYEHDEANTYTVGEEVTLDEYGRIIEFEGRYTTASFTYDEDGWLTKVHEDNNEGLTVQTWTYENNLPIESKYDPSGDFFWSNETKIITDVNENGKVVSCEEKITSIDSDGNVKYGTDKYDYEYDNHGIISSELLYLDGKLDHQTYIEYDEFGNILSFSSVNPKNQEEYLRVDFTYKMVDANTIKVVQNDCFKTLYNLENILFYIS